MLDQTKMNGGSRIAPHENLLGESKRVAGNMADVLHDITTLIELQTQLLACDARSTLRRLVAPSIAIVVAVVLLLGCVPVALIGLAHEISGRGLLSHAVALLVCAGGGAALAGLIAVGGWMGLRSSIGQFDHSRQELERNLASIKGLLKSRGMNH